MIFFDKEIITQSFTEDTQSFTEIDIVAIIRPLLVN